ncbi:MAG TPA: rhomboid family intramembrane serine protease [Thermoleophilaceae bacterium]|nr:rhomboid family intramembrane serine protease [Thermoleophilaceae bacterium]
MIPLKDDIPARDFPLVTVALIAAAVAAYAFAGDRLGDHAGFWALVVGGVFLWLFGPSVEDAMGRARFVLFTALGAGVTAALDPSSAGAGVVAAVLGGYALLYPRAHVVVLNLIPGFMTVTQVPALAVLVTWLPLQALAGGPDPAPLAGLAAGALTARVLAHRVQRDYQRAPAF